MTQLALSAIGADRPGIVGAVPRGGLGPARNQAGAPQAGLRGGVSMMLLVEAPEGTDLDAVREELARSRSQLDLDAVALHPLTEAGEARAVDPSHIVTVYGVDHPGIVHAVSARLASKAVNVTDLETRLVGEGLYAMVLEIALPPAFELEALEAMLAEVGAEQVVEVTIRPLEPDVM